MTHTLAPVAYRFVGRGEDFKGTTFPLNIKIDVIYFKFERGYFVLLVSRCGAENEKLNLPTVAKHDEMRGRKFNLKNLLCSNLDVTNNRRVSILKIQTANHDHLSIVLTFSPPTFPF